MSNFKTHAHTDTHIECEGGGVSHSLRAKGGKKKKSICGREAGPPQISVQFAQVHLF